MNPLNQKTSPGEGGQKKYYLRLVNLPPTAIHADVWRLLTQYDVDGCLKGAATT